MTQDACTDLRAIIDAAIEAHQGDERIDPAAIVAEVLTKLKNTELRYAADLYMRQLARAACRKKFSRDGEDESDGPDADQGELFPDEPERFASLQRRYPAAARSEHRERTYVRRDVMAADDISYNCRRLRADGNSKLEHATVLEGWWEWWQAKRKGKPKKAAAAKAEPVKPAA